MAKLYIDQVLQGEVIWVNCQLRNASFTVENIARNDGFDSINEFFDFFDKDFSGKIIHWTDKKY